MHTSLISTTINRKEYTISKYIDGFIIPVHPDKMEEYQRIASLAFFLERIETPEMEGGFLLFNQGLAASGYLIPLVKIIELLCGIAFLSGFFVPLAVVVVFPSR